MKTFNEYNKEISEADFGGMASQLKKYGGKENVKDTPKAPQNRSKYAPDYTMTGHKEKNTSTGRQYSKVLPDYDDEDDVKAAKKSVTTGATPQEKRGRGRPKGVGAKAGQYKPRDPEAKAASAAKAAASKAANKAKKAALTNEDCEEIFEGLTFDDMVEFMVDEEVVGLDELSQSTLGSYARQKFAQHRDAAPKGTDVDFPKGVAKSNAREAAYAGRLGSNIKPSLKAYAAKGEKHREARQNLEKEYHAAHAKLVRKQWTEEVEEIEELSKDTLNSYIKKGTADYKKKFKDAQDMAVNLDVKYPELIKAIDKQHKRTVGVATAKGRVAEEVEEVVEAAKIKVGDMVVPKIGPHKGIAHRVMHIHDNGEFNITPHNLHASKNRYRLGAVRCSQKDLQESVEQVDETSDARGTIVLGGKTHPRNRVPIEHYEEFKKSRPGSTVRFRGPRNGTDFTKKENATHFNIVAAADYKTESEFSLEDLELFIESEEFNELDDNELDLFESIFNEASDSVVKDKSGKVIKFKHEGDWKDSKKDPIVDKSGAKHTKQSRVRDLARNAIKKVSGKSEISFAQNESEKAEVKPAINESIDKAVAFYATKLTSNLIKE